MKYNFTLEETNAFFDLVYNQLFNFKQKIDYLNNYPNLPSISSDEKIISIYGSNGVGKSTINKQFIIDEFDNEIDLDNVINFILFSNDDSSSNLKSLDSIKFYYDYDKKDHKILENDYSTRITKLFYSSFCKGIGLNKDKIVVSVNDYINNYINNNEQYLLLPSLEIFYNFYNPSYFINYGFMKGSEYLLNCNLDYIQSNDFLVLHSVHKDKNIDNDFIYTIDKNLKNINMSLLCFLLSIRDIDNENNISNYIFKNTLSFTQDIFIDNNLIKGELRIDYFLKFINYLYNNPNIINSLIDIVKIKSNEIIAISRIMKNYNNEIEDRFNVIKPIILRHFSHIFDDIEIYNVFCPFYDTDILTLHILKDGNRFPLSNFIKTLNTSNSKIILMIKMFLLLPNNLKTYIFFDDFFTSLDNQNIHNIISFFNELITNKIINDEHRIVNFTHDIAIFKKINNMLSLPYKNKNKQCSMFSLHKKENENNSISIELKEFQVKGNFYLDYVKKEKFNREKPIRNIILILISLPYFRNAIEDIYGDKHSLFNKITSYLHYKERSIKPLKNIIDMDFFNNMNSVVNNKKDIFTIIDNCDSYWNLLEICFNYVKNKTILDIEDSLFLCLYSRIYIEKNILLTYLDEENINAEYMNQKYPYNQTAMIIEEYKNLNPKNTSLLNEIDAIKRIFSNFMHINSTEYQYMLNVDQQYILNKITKLKTHFEDKK